MIIRLVLLSMLISSTVFAQAKDEPVPGIDAGALEGFNDPRPMAPYKGVLHSKEPQRTLSYHCRQKADIECTFVEMSIRKGAEPEDWEKQSKEMQRMLPILQKGLDKECAAEYLSGIVAVVRGEKPAETRGEEEAAFSIRELDAAERVKYAEMIKKLCLTRDFAEASRAGFDQQTRTCTMSPHTFTLHFSAASAQETLWVSKDETDEECGTTLGARFEINEPPGTGFPEDWVLKLKNLRPAQERPPSPPPGRCTEMGTGETVYAKSPSVKTRHQCEYVLIGVP